MLVCKYTDSDCNSLAENKMPVLCTLGHKERRYDEKHACHKERKSEVSNIEETACYESWKEYEGVL